MARDRPPHAARRVRRAAAGAGVSRRCDREGEPWPRPVYGPPRPGRRCGWCDCTDDTVAFGYDHLPPACAEHQPERLRTLADLAALRRGVVASAPEQQRVYAAGEAFARGGTDDGWTLYPRARVPPPAPRAPAGDGRE